MSDLINAQQYKDALLDAATISDAANTDKTIISRKGFTYLSAPMATRLILEQGTIDATVFATRALMEASLLLDNAYALVTDDSIDANNGYYQKRSGIWTYLKYNTANKINAIEQDIYGVYDPIPIPAHTLSSGAVTDVGVIQKPNPYGFVVSTPILLQKGQKIKFDYYGYAFAPLSETDSTMTYAKPIVSVGILTGVNISGKVDYIAPYDMYIVICSDNRLTPFNLTINQLKVSRKILSKEDISTSTKIGSHSMVASAEVVRNLSDELKVLSNYVSKTETIPVATLSGGYMWSEGIPITDIPVKGIEVTLKEGDSLKFDYLPFGGVTVWLSKDSVAVVDALKVIPLLYHSVASDKPLTYYYTAPRPTTLRLVNAITNSVMINNAAANYVDLGNWGLYQPSTFFGFANTIRTQPFSVSKGDLVTITKPLAGSIAIHRQLNNGQWIGILGQSIKESPDVAISWRSDEDCLLTLSGKSDTQFLINRGGESLDDKLESFTPSGNRKVPMSIALPPKETVFATAMNFILKTEMIGGIDYIKISADLGKTWTQIRNILVDIVAYHFFSDGTIMLCSPKKVYWTRDYLTLNESTVLDHDGSPFVPTNRHFFGMQSSDAIWHVDGKEIYVWGDYLVDADISVSRIWYSVDNGRTIKCAAKFGTTPMGGSPRPSRHVHRVYQHAPDESFYITTGDAGNECMIIRAVYNSLADTWNWDIKASGDDYKFGNIITDKVFAYLVTDYTLPSYAEKKGIYRVPLADIGDITKYQLIYKTLSSEWGLIAPVSLLLDNNGNKVLMPDYLGAGYLWLARDGLDFKKVAISPSVLLTYTIGTNYRGDIYCVAYNNSGELNTPSALKLNRGTYNITQALRDAGVSDFMRGSLMIHGMTNVI